MAEHSSAIPTRPAERGWSRWLAAFLFGLLLMLALLLASWFLRACVPVEPSTNLSMLEALAPPAPPPPPDPTPTLKATLEGVQADERHLKIELAALSADFKNRLAQCKPVEAKPPPPPPPVAKPAPPPPLPADRWASKDLGMLQGCWRLGHDTEGSIAMDGRTARCAIKAGRICFGSNGSGERQTTANCPGAGTIRCTAPLTARFGNDNTLGTTQPTVRCTPGTAGWNGPPNSLSCRRVSDTLALCRDRLNFEHEFRRE
jgi:hypothetical protein